MPKRLLLVFPNAAFEVWASPAPSHASDARAATRVSARARAPSAMGLSPGAAPLADQHIHVAFHRTSLPL
eukprot:4675726-Pleurochrysis_carterae.AAC.1